MFCRAPKDARSVICKRLMAMEGETVFNNEKGFEEYVSVVHGASASIWEFLHMPSCRFGSFVWSKFGSLYACLGANLGVCMHTLV